MIDSVKNEMKLKKRIMSPEMDYSNLLSTYAVTDLIDILKSWKVKGYSKLNKTELIGKACCTVLENLYDRALYFNNNHFDILDMIAIGKSGQVRDTESVGELLSLGVILHGNVFDQVSYVIPDEIGSILREFYNKNSKIVEMNTVLISYMDLSVSVYGVIKEDVLIEFIKNTFEIANTENLKNLLMLNICHTKYVEYKEGYFYYFTCDDYKNVYEAAQNTKYEYMHITIDMIKDFMEKDSVYWTSGHDNMIITVKKMFHKNKHFALDIINKYMLFTSYNYSFDDIFETLIKDLNVSEKSEIDEFAGALIEVHNNIPHWLLKGCSPLVISKTPIVNEDKIGRNDPCSCGSGKKYKKCCLIK